MPASILKKFFPVLISLLALAALVACGESAEPTAASTSEQTQVVDDHAGHEHADHDGHDHAGHDHDDHGEDAATPAVPVPVAGDRPPGPLRVVVSVPPLLWPFEDVLSEDDELEVLMTSGGSAHDIELTPEDVKLIDRADLLVLVGFGLDGQIERVAKNRPSAHREVLVLGEVAERTGQLNIFESLQGMDAHDGHDHTGHDHDHGAHSDPHLWLVPTIMSVYAEEVGIVLERAYTAIGGWDDATRGRVEQEAGNSADKAAIADLTFSTRLRTITGPGIVCNHAAFDLFCEYYGIEVLGVLQPNHGVEPTPGDVQGVIDAIRENGARGILAVPGHDMASVRRVAEATGVPIIEFDPLGDGNWPVLMDKWYIALYEAMTGEPPLPPQ